MHDVSLIATIAGAFVSAWLLGIVTQRLRLSPIVGYLLAGILIGPHTPGFVGNVDIAQQLAEIGVILLMFGVGLHFHLKDLLAVKTVAIPGAIFQSLIATTISIVVFSGFGFPIVTGAVIGMAMAVASTVVLMRMLMDADILHSSQGHIAVGWLVVEDIFTVVLLVVIPVLGSQYGVGTSHGIEQLPLWETLTFSLVKLGAFVALVALAGSQVVPWVLVQIARLRSREIFTLTVLVFSIAIAAGSYFFFGASMALGAFLAGMVVGQTPVSHQAAADALPLRDAFAVLFFVSVGMLADPSFLLEAPFMLAAALLIILIAKPLAALFIVALLGHPARTALTVAVGLAQIGEFSFILSDLARRHGLMPDAGQSVLVAAAIISIALNPLLFRALPTIEAWLKRRRLLWRLLNGRAERLAAAANVAETDRLRGAIAPGARQAIVVGYGGTGRSIHRLLREAGLATVVIDLNMDTVSSLRADGHAAIFGDGSHETLLKQAGLQNALYLIVALPHAADCAAVVAAARSLSPSVRIFVRARYLREREGLEQAGATAAVFEEVEAAVGLARLVLADSGVHRQAAERKIRDIRLQLIMENISNLRSQRVSSVMVPWARVRCLPASADRKAVLEMISQERFSRWPVVERRTGNVIGYLLAKDLIAHATESHWSHLVRSISAVRPDDDVESVLARMQEESATMYVVEDRGPVGLITQEDILEQVVGQIQDEYPHEAHVSVAQALANGAIVLELAAKTGEQAIRDLVTAIPVSQLPEGADRSQIVDVALQREQEISTDLGNGVAIPHARYPGVVRPILVFGRTTEGLFFSVTAQELVHLVFLLVTPAERPETQLALLGQLAHICREYSQREALLRAATVEDILVILDKRSRPLGEAPVNLAGSSDAVNTRR
jgi:CPA2 family monovalent cation:H+ antiporter-2